MPLVLSCITWNLIKLFLNPYWTADEFFPCFSSDHGLPKYLVPHHYPLKSETYAQRKSGPQLSSFLTVCLAGSLPAFSLMGHLQGPLLLLSFRALNMAKGALCTSNAIPFAVHIPEVKKCRSRGQLILPDAGVSGYFSVRLGQFGNI